jgi:glyoxylase-like metal-dependent hydrolase (beta-lactamase superfamily II)
VNGLVETAARDGAGRGRNVLGRPVGGRPGGLIRSVRRRAGQQTVSMSSITLGNVEIIRVFELPLIPLPRAVAFPDTDPELWRRNADWLEPEYFDAAADALPFSMQSWVLRSEGRTILVDTGIGNAKQRPGDPPLHELDTPYLAELAAAGVVPEDVDVVVCTHVHGDHVGWNTRLVDGEWVPTFGNARYLFARADFDFWDPANGHPSRSGPRMANVFEDSVAPVHQAGLAELWDDHYDIDANLRLEPAPGHTPGSAVLWLSSGTDRAAFVGDLLHSPLQVLEPDESSCFDEDEAAARATRRRVLAQVADERVLLVPAHLPAAGAVEVGAAAGGYTISRWGAFG